MRRVQKQRWKGVATGLGCGCDHMLMYEGTEKWRKALEGIWGTDNVMNLRGWWYLIKEPEDLFYWSILKCPDSFPGHKGWRMYKNDQRAYPKARQFWWGNKTYPCIAVRKKQTNKYASFCKTRRGWAGGSIAVTGRIEDLYLRGQRQEKGIKGGFMDKVVFQWGLEVDNKHVFTRNCGFLVTEKVWGNRATLTRQCFLNNCSPNTIRKRGGTWALQQTFITAVFTERHRGKGQRRNIRNKS